MKKLIASIILAVILLTGIVNAEYTITEINQEIHEVEKLGYRHYENLMIAGIEKNILYNSNMLHSSEHPKDGFDNERIMNLVNKYKKFNSTLILDDMERSLFNKLDELGNDNIIFLENLKPGSDFKKLRDDREKIDENFNLMFSVCFDKYMNKESQKINNGIYEFRVLNKKEFSKVAELLIDNVVITKDSNIYYQSGLNNLKLGEQCIKIFKYTPEQQKIIDLIEQSNSYLKYIYESATKGNKLSIEDDIKKDINIKLNKAEKLLNEYRGSTSEAVTRDNVNYK